MEQSWRRQWKYVFCAKLSLTEEAAKPHRYHCLAFLFSNLVWFEGAVQLFVLDWLHQTVSGTQNEAPSTPSVVHRPPLCTRRPRLLRFAIGSLSELHHPFLRTCP